MSADLDVAVVGAGIAGLALAHRLRQDGRQVHVFESADHIGGRMRTIRRDGYQLDTGAEMLGTTGYPATWRLIRELGLSEVDFPLIGRDLAMWRDGRAHPNVGDTRGLVTGAGMSTRARLRLAGLMTRRKDYDTDTPERTPQAMRTIAEFATGDLHDYLLQPLAGGFFGWDTRMACAGPLLSHLLAVGTTNTFRTCRTGMDTVAHKLAAGLDISTGTAVREVVETSAGGSLRFDGSVVTARTVVLAVPAPVAARLHRAAPDYVHACRFRPMIKVCCLLDRPIGPIGGGRSFAMFVPAVEDDVLAGVLFDERKHPQRTPPGRGMITLVGSAATTRHLLDATDAEIESVLVGRAERYAPGLGAAVRSAVVARFPHGMVMPTPAALAARPAFVRRPGSAIEYAGDWYSLRPSSEAAVRSAELVARRMSLTDNQVVERA